MSLCLTAAGVTVALALQGFTLSWTHSVERIEWRENWRLTAAGLLIEEATVEGSGAGMEIPEGAVLREGAWHYRPSLPAQERVAFADAGREGSDWTLCDETGTCRPLREILPVRGEGFVMSACERPGVPLAAVPGFQPAREAAPVR